MINSAELVKLIKYKDQDSFNLINDLEKIFLSQSPNLLDQIYQGIEFENKSLIAKSAHTLKASCSYLGMVEMCEICKSIEETVEKMGNHSNSDLYFDISILLKKLQKSHVESVFELRQFIQSLKKEIGLIGQLN